MMEREQEQLQGRGRDQSISTASSWHHHHLVSSCAGLACGSTVEGTRAHRAL